MKIGIITFHCAHNYGAVLQAYALQEQLKELGHNVEIINYRPKSITEDYEKTIYFYRPYKNVLRKLLSYTKMILFSMIRNLVQPHKIKLRKQCRQKFYNFINTKLNLSEISYRKPFEEQLDYDCYIIGSDQVWNIDLTNGIDPIYWGNFKVGKGAKIMTYAASMSNYNLSNDKKRTIKLLLNNFSAIGVRELELKNYLDEEFNVLSDVVVDPTLLVDENVLNKIASEPKIGERYVLIYSLGLYEYEYRIAKAIADQLEIVIVTIWGDLKIVNFGDRCLPVSPEDFIGWFQKADFVVTASFHGTAFSILNRKPFYAVKRGGDKDSRLSTLLDSLGIGDRLVDKDCNVVVQQIAYQTVHSKLNIIRKQSLYYLIKNLN